MINPAVIAKGVQVAKQVVDTAETVNTVAKSAGINQDSIFAQKENEGKGGPVNSVLQAADTLSFGTVGKQVGAGDKLTGGLISKTIGQVDVVAKPILAVTDTIDGVDSGDIAKAAKKMPDVQA